MKLVSWNVDESLNDFELQRKWDDELSVLLSIYKEMHAMAREIAGILKLFYTDAVGLFICFGVAIA